MDFNRLVPDFATVTATLQGELSLVLLEGKVAENKSFQIWDDKTKLGKCALLLNEKMRLSFWLPLLDTDISNCIFMIGQEMKLALDSILVLSPGDDVCVVGILVRGMFLLILSIHFSLSILHFIHLSLSF
jgi:hypothetical protein